MAVFLLVIASVIASRDVAYVAIEYDYEYLNYEHLLKLSTLNVEIRPMGTCM